MVCLLMAALSCFAAAAAAEGSSAQTAFALIGTFLSILSLSCIFFGKLLNFCQFPRKTVCSCQLCSGVHHHCGTLPDLYQDHGDRWDQPCNAVYNCFCLNFRTLLPFRQAGWNPRPTGVPLKIHTMPTLPLSSWLFSCPP